MTDRKRSKAEETSFSRMVSEMQEQLSELERLSEEEIVAQSRAEHPTWREDVLRAWCAAKLRLDKEFFTIADPLFGTDWRETVQAIACPTLLITADPGGGIVTPEIAQ